MPRHKGLEQGNRLAKGASRARPADRTLVGSRSKGSGPYRRRMARRWHFETNARSQILRYAIWHLYERE